MIGGIMLLHNGSTNLVDKKVPLQLALMVIALFSLVERVQAAGDVFDQFFRYTEKEHKAFFQDTPGETVDPFTGILRIVHEDLFLPGKAGLDLRIVRTYNSKIWGRADQLDLEPFLAEKEHSVLGYGWTFHMGRLKNPNATGSSGICSGDFPIYEAPDGTARVFYPITGSSTSFISKDYWKMEKNCAALSGAGVCIWSNTGVRYEFSNLASNQYVYDMDTLVWPLSAIVDVYENEILVEYIPDGKGAIDSIIDTYGRTIGFSYVTQADGKRLEAIYANGKTYSFGYTSYAARPGSRRFLTSVTPPVGPGYGYSYGINNTVAQNQYALNTITYPNGGTVTYGYGSVTFFTGLETVPFSVVTSRTVSGRNVTAGSWSFSYISPGSGSSMHVTTITRPDGIQDTYTIYGFGYVAGRNATGYTWLVGLIKEISRAGGAEVETLTWGSSPKLNSNAYYTAPVYSANCGAHFIWDQGVYPAVLTQRDLVRNSATYTTTYSNFDAYGQPQTVSESGQKSRTTIWTYFYATDVNMVRDRPKTQHVCVSGECFDNSWTYQSGPYYFRDSETLSGVKTTFSPDTDGNIKTITNALGETLTLSGYVTGYGIPTTLNFNGAFSIVRSAYWEGWLHSETNGRGYTTTYSYDDIGRITGIDLPGTSESTSYSYATDGSLAYLKRGAYTKTSNLDGFGRVTSTSDTEGILTSMRYDSMGRNWFKSYPYDSSIGEVGEKLDFDRLGRVTQQTKGYRPGSGTCDVSGACAVTHSFSQSCVTSTVSRASGDTAVTKRCSESFGNPDEQRLANVTDADSKLWQYANNAYGNVKTVTAPISKGNRSYGYDTTKQFLMSETTNESGSTTFGRNNIGQMTSKTDARGVQVIYGRSDPLSRVRTITYQSGSPDNVTKDYDNANNVKQVASTNGGTIEPSYDEVNRIYSQTWTYSGKAYTTTYNYDAAGCLYSMTYPTGLTVTMTCDSANRVKTISLAGSTIVSSILYHPSGQVKAMSYSNGKSTTLTYDDRARAKTVTSSGVIGLTYGYDGADNVVSFNNTAVAGSSRTMTYTKLDQLETSIASSLWGSAVYDYDEVGNRTVKSVGSYTTTYTCGTQNRLDSATGGSTRFKSLTFTWDLAGRLASSSDGVSYRYDGLGRRILKAEPSQSTLYHYDAFGRLISETTATGAKLRDYIYLGGKLVAVDGCITVSPPATCTERLWYHTDIAGSVLARSDSAGNVVRFDYQSWGEPWTAPTAAGDRQYNGRVFDPGTGFHDYGARMYWPEIGRFISVDSVGPDTGNPTTFNRYAYVLNNPYKYTDPNGRWAFLAVTGAIGLVGGAIYGAISSAYSEEGFSFNAVYKWGAIGGVAGLTLGAGTSLVLTGTATASVAEVGAAGMSLLGIGGEGGRRVVEKVAARGGQASRILQFTERGLQKGFTKHGADFGLAGNWNPARASEFRSTINQFINSEGVQTITGTYRGNPVMHYLNPSTGLNVMVDMSGNYVSGWRLGAEQLQSVLSNGRLW
jgi:RHS repeat-associated protein